MPAYNAVHNILTNPIYAGAYAFGRTGSQVSVVEGRKHIRRGVRRPIAEWDVLLKDQHEGYITWNEFERNQHLIADNATGMGRTIARGAVRQGEMLLAGLLRCGHCGRKLQVHYSGKHRRAKRRRQRGNLSWLWPRRVMRRLTPVGNTTPSIRPIASLPASWSGAGTMRLRQYTAPKATLPPSLRKNDRRSARPSASS